MGRLRLVSEYEKDVICENVYHDGIVQTYDFLISCESFANIIGEMLPETCYTNFRDCIFHYWKLYRTFENTEIDKQLFAVIEHSKRAKTDASVALMKECEIILGELLVEKSFSEELERRLIKMHDKIANVEMHLRMSGMMIGESSFFCLDDEQILDLFDEMLRIFNEDAIDIFKEHVRKRKMNSYNNN